MGNLSGLKEYMQGPEFAKVKDTYIPYPPAKVDVNTPVWFAQDFAQNSQQTSHKQAQIS